MVVTQTPRVKYNLDASGTIGVQHDNWDRADEVAGLWYTDSVTGEPPVGKRYDGMVCVEKDTGISYRYLWNGSSFDKKFVNYPMYLRAYQTDAVVGNGTRGAWGWGTWDDNWNINAKAASWKEAVTNAIKIQVKALYSLKIHSTWGGFATPTGVNDRDSGYYINGAQDGPASLNKLLNGWNSPSANTCIAVRRVFNIGDTLRAYNYNNGGGNNSLTSAVELSIIRPVW